MIMDQINRAFLQPVQAVPPRVIPTMAAPGFVPLPAGAPEQQTGKGAGNEAIMKLIMQALGG